mmetsp:Transcript_50724/g.147692  ORF Transcript_50724/g.147692 Transcript_50724/m.147692 type:complete len:300 (+) Transcript_50724:111-1010(+)
MTQDESRAQFRDSKVVGNPALPIGTLFSVAGRVALVTGGSRGIGLMIAKALVQNGAKVYITARSGAVCDRVAAELTKLGPGSCVSLPGDVTSEEACRAVAATIAKNDGQLHILVNNAGIVSFAAYDEFPTSAWAKEMGVNVTSIFALTRACTPLLVAGSGGNMNPTHVINVGSANGHPVGNVFDRSPAYTASKAAVAQLTRWFAAKLCRDGVCVNCIEPAVFPSKMAFDHHLVSEEATDAVRLNHPMGRIGHENDMAGIVLFLASRASAFVTGECIGVDGGMANLRGAERLPLGTSAKL